MRRSTETAEQELFVAKIGTREATELLDEIRACYVKGPGPILDGLYYALKDFVQAHRGEDDVGTRTAQ